MLCIWIISPSFYITWEFEHATQLDQTDVISLETTKRSSW